MLKIYIPNNNTYEREYILDIFFNEFLEIKYKIYYCNEDQICNNWVIVLQNENRLIFEDCFFNKYLNNLEYLDINNIPKYIKYQKKIANQYISKNNIPIIYGNDKFEITTNNKQITTIISGIDIFASAFFMLSRWEEYVNKTRDKHNRFSAHDSLAHSQDFLDRPIVDEYINMLKNLLTFLDNSLKFKKRNKELFLTHDVDFIYKWNDWKQIIKVSIADILKRRDIGLSFERIAEYFLIKRGKIKDPFDTFDLIMDKSEAIGIKSRFYFMSGGTSEYDNRYKIDNKKTTKLINYIKNRGHVVGFHPSYNAYNDKEQFKKEKEALEKVSNCKIQEGREHYLRFEVPVTWQIWEDNNMKIDSTCGYHDKEGFRCGTGDEFSVFNILTRKKLNLKERPLIVMDCSLFDYQNLNYKEATKYLNNIRNSTNSFTMLWHNSYIDHINFYKQYLVKEKNSE